MSMVSNILLADEDEDDIYSFRVALSYVSKSITVTVVNDGNQLMNYLAKQIPDALFLDARLPSKDGFECIQEIRSDARYSSLPVIILTGFDQYFIRELFIKQGADYFLTKPPSIGELSNKLEDILIRDWPLRAPLKL